jgi:5,6-dimethylbenzimidazole synthase
MDYPELLELLKTRRSIRAFTPDPVPDDVIDDLIEAGRWAPSGANSQPWEFLVIRRQETKERLASIVREYQELMHKAELTRPPELRWPSAARPVSDPAWKTAPVLVLVCGDPRVSKSFPLLTYLERGPSHFVSGLASAFLQMALAATSLGLGCHWVSAVGAGYCSAMVKELLEIPEDYTIYDMLTVGYPAMQPAPRLVREREAITHREHYDWAKYRTDQQIREFLVSLRPKP